MNFDGNQYQVEISEISPGNLQVIVNGTRHLVKIKDAPVDTENHSIKKPEIFVQENFSESRPPTPTHVNANQPGLVAAPMPGDIIEINVIVGDHINVGDKLLVLEAMKMKNLIRSPQSGIISAIEVSKGQSVKFGSPLIRFG